MCRNFPYLSHLGKPLLATSKGLIQVSSCDRFNLLFLVRLWVVSGEAAGILKSYQYIDTLAFWTHVQSLEQIHDEQSSFECAGQYVKRYTGVILFTTALWRRSNYSVQTIQTNKTEGHKECQQPKYMYFKNRYNPDCTGSVWLLEYISNISPWFKWWTEFWQSNRCRDVTKEGKMLSSLLCRLLRHSPDPGLSLRFLCELWQMLGPCSNLTNNIKANWPQHHVQGC